eukprot:6192431-Pleurochrysis_carterae.AAC.7
MTQKARRIYRANEKCLPMYFFVFKCTRLSEAQPHGAIRFDSLQCKHARCERLDSIFGSEPATYCIPPSALST